MSTSGLPGRRSPTRPRASMTPSNAFTPFPRIKQNTDPHRLIRQQSKMLKCAGNEDIITMKADDTGDVVTLCSSLPVSRHPSPRPTIVWVSSRAQLDASPMSQRAVGEPRSGIPTRRGAPDRVTGSPSRDLFGFLTNKK